MRYRPLFVSLSGLSLAVSLLLASSNAGAWPKNQQWGHVSHESTHSGHWDAEPHAGYVPNRRWGGFHGPFYAGGAHGPWIHQWGNGDIHHFYAHDFAYWHGGYWAHSWYGGRFGWWWVVSGVWFFYPAPVYPYPDPYVPPYFVVPPPPPDAAAATQTQFWYFCPASNGYYPYITSCPSGWQQVPATDGSDQAPANATGAAPQAAPPATPPPSNRSNDDDQAQASDDNDAG